MPRPILVCLLPCLLLLLPACADAPDDTPLGACYMGYGKMLESARSRQLSLNAHVQQFLYQPGGLGIAYQGIQKDGDNETQFIRLVGVKQGTATTLVSTISHPGENAEQDTPPVAPFTIDSWSGDGRYLLLSQQRYVTTPGEADNYSVETFECVDVGVTLPRLISIALPEPDPTDKTAAMSSTRWWWSPDRSRLLFAAQGRLQNAPSNVPLLHTVFAKIYDPKNNSLQDMILADNQVVRGWLDGGHLLLDDSPRQIETAPSRKYQYASYDIGAGTQAGIPAPKQMPPLPSDLGLTPSAVSPKASYMTLDDEAHHIQDHQKVGAVDAHALWVRRTQGPKLMSAASVGLTPGADDTQAVWSPTGAQIAFVAHGDLFVTDLTMRDATPGEKYAAGEKLTCAEERDLAANNLKQVGLAIIQYQQDYDEVFPPADKWQDRVTPYLKDASLFSPAGHPVVYRVPPGMTLASVESPADTVMGYVDLPCATVTLYVDGHVRALPKEATTGTAGGR